MATDLLSAFSLMLVLEGLLPFANPGLLRRVLLHAAQLDDRGLRISGLASMLLGVVLLYFARH